ncbi:sensor histidine kinase [Alteribacter keqinensis]|uniref:histidine kinase n=1 Tax=Alteribacter keqinensis TaxID=2483800 RepID=A0A3M7TN23_9BACI|nr:sensor histidine kinase [Alteribacter keqinensis]RNA67033.1 sensor histidine kinase [Alteribacter keqinensis]
MWELLVLMLERLGIIVMVAFIMTRISYFRQILDRYDVTFTQRLKITILFGLFGIIGTYTGLAVSPNQQTFSVWTWDLNEDEALANSRVIGIVVAGLLGGWRVGTGAGIIAGAHRYALGGYTAFACGISAVVAGMLAGLVHRFVKKKRIVSLPAALGVGALCEAIQMGIILVVATPFDQALALVQMIGMPMILANGVGAMIFVLIIRSVLREEERIGAAQTERALRIADRTVGHLRKGLTPESAKATCAILVKEVGAVAVSITDKTRILAFEGQGKDHHPVGSEIQTPATKEVIETGSIIEAKEEDIACSEPRCPIRSGIIVPLKQEGDTIGTLKFYVSSEKEITPTKRELVKGVSLFLSNQLELARVDELKALAGEAEVKALQAQVSPHFLFNALNVIISMIRIDPANARKLLLHLSRYLRQNLTSMKREQATLTDELNHVRAYMAIQEARFQDRLKVTYDLDETAMTITVPSMTLQPLVENAMKHGFEGKKRNGFFELGIHVKIQDSGAFRIEVTDNGAGIGKERLKEVKKQPVESQEGTGLGLYNVNRRLVLMFGEASELHVESREENGTRVWFDVVKGGERK